MSRQEEALGQVKTLHHLHPHDMKGQANSHFVEVVAGSGGPQNSLTPAQLAAQQAAQQRASERAKLRSRQPTDKNMPEGVEEIVIGDGVQKYKDLQDIERRLDATMTRKRLDIENAVNRNVKVSDTANCYNMKLTQEQCYRTLRIWISNTVEDQPWQSTETLDVDAFDFTTNMNSSYRVKIEGRLLDEEEDTLG